MQFRGRGRTEKNVHQENSDWFLWSQTACGRCWLLYWVELRWWWGGFREL